MSSLYLPPSNAQVSNPGPGDRIHLVIDVAESPREQVPLPPGTICDYLGSQLQCRGPTGAAIPVGAYVAAQQTAEELVNTLEATLAGQRV